MPKNTIALKIEKFNELYIMNRNRYLIQLPPDETDSYRTLIWTDENKIIKLNDSMIRSHILHKKTYGVFCGELFSKFIEFDVDSTGNITDSKFLTYRLVNLLMTVYNLPSKFIHVSLSGNKGYHVAIFIDKPISPSVFYRFYEDVRAQLGVTRKEIEFRPTDTVGIKLPLGVHQKTGSICWFCDTITLEPIHDLDYILKVQAMDTDDFLSLVNDALLLGATPLVLNSQEAESFEDIVQDTNICDKSLDDIEKDVLDVIKLGRLKYPRTRHITTLNIAKLLIGNYGWDREQTASVILNIMKQTPREFFSEKTNFDFIVKEIDRITQIVEDKNYSLTRHTREIKITKSEILSILSVGKQHLRKLLFSILVHSKKYAKVDGTFYMTYSQITNMGNTQNRTRLLEYIFELSDGGLLEIISRGEIDKALSKANNHVTSKPNVYRVAIEENTSDEYVVINRNKDLDFCDIVSQLVDKNDLKHIVTKNEFYRQFKSYYRDDTSNTND